jgi:hypothetical protein
MVGRRNSSERTEIGGDSYDRGKRNGTSDSDEHRPDGNHPTQKSRYCAARRRDCPNKQPNGRKERDSKESPHENSRAQ